MYLTYTLLLLFFPFSLSQFHTVGSKVRQVGSISIACPPRFRKTNTRNLLFFLFWFDSPYLSVSTVGK